VRETSTLVQAWNAWGGWVPLTFDLLADVVGDGRGGGVAENPGSGVERMRVGGWVPLYWCSWFDRPVLSEVEVLTTNG